MERTSARLVRCVNSCIVLKDVLLLSGTHICESFKVRA